MAFILQTTETPKQTLKQAEGASVEKTLKQGVDTTQKQTVDVTPKLGEGARPKTTKRCIIQDTKVVYILLLMSPFCFGN